MRDVRITGLGVASAAGGSTEETLAHFKEGRRHAGPSSLVKTCLSQPVFEAKCIPPVADESMMRTFHLAMHAVREAIASANLDIASKELRVGVCLGTTVACQLNDVEFLTAFRETGQAPMAPVDRFLKGNLAAAAARELGVEGPSVTVTNACASGTDAIGIASSWIKAGICDVAIAGGADELNRVPLAGFNSLGILSPELCAPFDVNRQGLNLGEGAGVVVLESASMAKKRGVCRDLFVAGFGTACDAYHLTSPRPDGAFLKVAIQRALSEAALVSEDIAFVNAHGTATPDNDRVEGAVLADVFGPKVVMLSTKGYTGHTLGAAGGLEAVFSALALRAGWIPLCAGFSERDPNIPVAPVKELTAIHGRYALSTSLAFGGGNSAVVIGCDKEAG